MALPSCSRVLQSRLSRPPAGRKRMPLRDAHGNADDMEGLDRDAASRRCSAHRNRRSFGDPRDPVHGAMVTKRCGLAACFATARTAAPHRHAHRQCRGSGCYCPDHGNARGRCRPVRLCGGMGGICVIGRFAAVPSLRSPQAGFGGTDSPERPDDPRPAQLRMLQPIRRGLASPVDARAHDHRHVIRRTDSPVAVGRAGVAAIIMG